METQGERLMIAIREFNEEMGRIGNEQWESVNAILLEDERKYCQERGVCFACGFEFTSISKAVIGMSGLRIHDDCIDR